MRPFKPVNALAHTMLCLRIKNKQLTKQEKHTRQKVLLICNRDKVTDIFSTLSFMSVAFSSRRVLRKSIF